MIEYAAFVSVLLAGDVGACLLVEPPTGESEALRDLYGLFVAHAVSRSLADK
jgi:hypothetical protein